MDDIILPMYSTDEEEDEKEEEISHISTHNPEQYDHFLCIVERKIEIVGVHPLTALIGRAMEQHKEVIMQIVLMANKKPVYDVNSEWVNNELEAKCKRLEQWESVYNFRSFLLELAQCAAIEGQVQQTSDEIQARKFRQLRVDEVESQRFQSNRKRAHYEVEESTEDSYYKGSAFPSDTELFVVKERTPSPPVASYIDWPSVSSDEEDETASHYASPSNPSMEKPLYRQKLRNNLSAHIDYVVPLGKGKHSAQPFTAKSPFSASNRQNNAAANDIRQNKKRFPLKKQYNNYQNGANVNQRLSLEERELQLNAQKRIIQQMTMPGVGSGISFDDTEVASCSDNILPFSSLANSSPKKSCLKKTSARKGMRITFAPDVQDFVAKSRNITIGRNHTDFLNISFGELTIGTTDQNKKNAMFLPNCDIAVKPALRQNPRISKNMKRIKNEMAASFNCIMQRAHHLKKPRENQGKTLVVSRLLIADSMLSALDMDCFRNMDMMSLNYPRMPDWFIETLNDWFEDDTLEGGKGGLFVYGKIFVCIGLDLFFYFAHPTNDEIGTCIDFLDHLARWFQDKMSELDRRHQRDKRKNPENPSSAELSFKGFSSEQNECYDIWRIKICQMPQFIVITIPEIGDWKRNFVELNKRFREFVQQNQQHFVLLDWAEMVHRVDQRSVDTVAKRATLLVNAMMREHGVLC